MIDFHVIIDTSDPELDTFYLDIKGTRYEYLPILDLNKMRTKVVKELKEDENGNPFVEEKTIYCEPEIDFKPGSRYLVMGNRAYTFVKSKVHLGPRGENFYDLTKMEYLLTNEGYIFKFCYVNWKRISEFINKAKYDLLSSNLEKVKKRLKRCELNTGESKRSGKPWYMLVYYKLEDVDGKITNFIDNENIPYEFPKMKFKKKVETIEEQSEAFDFLINYDKWLGLDYETNGFPFDDEEFYHMGVGISTQEGEGYYFDMDWMQVQAEKGDSSHWDYFLTRYEEFNEKKAEVCWTYNVSFEMRCTYLLYGKLYFYHEAASINKMQGLVKKNYSLKYTSMKNLYVSSWDNSFEYLSDNLGTMMEWKDPSYRHKASEVYYTNSLDEVEEWKRDENGEVLAGEYERLDCETKYFTESDIWKEIVRLFPRNEEELKLMIIERWGQPFKCIPSDIHTDYCPLDSFYTVLLPLKALQKYSEKALDCFDNNLRMGALLGIHGIPLDEDYRQKMEDISTSHILWSKLNLIKWWLNIQISRVPEEVKKFRGFKYYFANYLNGNGRKLTQSIVTPSDLKSVLNEIVDENGIIYYSKCNEIFGEEIGTWISSNIFDLVPEENSREFKALSQDYQTFFNDNCSYFCINPDSELEEERLLRFKWFDDNIVIDFSLDDVRQYYIWVIQLEQVKYLLNEVDQEIPRLVYSFLNDKGVIEEKDGYEISEWIKNSVFNFNSNNNFLDICLMAFNYYGDVFKEVMNWEEGVQFEDDENLEERMTKPITFNEEFFNEEVEEERDEKGNLIRILTRRDQYTRDYAALRYYERLKPYIENLGVETVKERCERIEKRVDEKTGKEYDEVVPYYNEYKLDVKQTKAYRDYLRNGDVLWCFIRLCGIDGLIVTKSLYPNDQGEFELIFRDQLITEEPFWEIPVNAASDGNFYWLCMLSFRDRIFGNYSTNKMFIKLYGSNDIMDKTIMGVTMFQYFFTCFRKYEKVLGTYIGGQFGSKYVHTCNKEDKNLICTERWYDENKHYLKVFSPYKVCEKQSKRWSAPMHTVPSKSEVKRCVTTPPGYLLSYFDISGAEIRTVAYQSNCKFFLDCYKEGRDVYITAAGIVEPGEDKSYYKAQRGKYKQILLGRLFGMGDELMAEMTESTLQESIERGNQMFKLMPEVEQYIQKKAEYCTLHEGVCDTILGDTMIMEGKRTDQWQRLGINQVIQGFTAIALADGFFNNIYQSYKTNEIIVRPVNVVHDSSQNLFETKHIFEICDFYSRNMREYLYEKYNVDWAFDTLVGVNYYDMVEISNLDKDKLSLKGTYTALKLLLDKLKADGVDYSIESIENENGESLTLTYDENYAEGFESDIPNSALKQSICQYKVSAMYEFDKSKYKAIIFR